MRRMSWKLPCPVWKNCWIMQSDDVEIKDFKLDNAAHLEQEPWPGSTLCRHQKAVITFGWRQWVRPSTGGRFSKCHPLGYAELDAGDCRQKANIRLDNKQFGKIIHHDTLWRGGVDSEIISAIAA
ncbi:MAG: hypothetical protein R2788_11990 [Saprospiraceae bacterium]